MTKKSINERQAVTFVIPAYNAADTLVETLDSVFNDNFSVGDELLIVDDCSTDNTVKIADKFIANNKYKKSITLIKHAYNKGDGAARNTAIEFSKNELIFCLDSDNVLNKGSITPLVNKLVRSKADFASFEELHYFKTDVNNIELKWHFPNVKYDLAYHLSHVQVPSASGNYLFTKSAWARVGRFPEYAGALNNWGFGVTQAVHGTKTVILKKSHYFHRFGHESLWIRDSKEGKLSLIALQLIIPYLNLIREEDIEYIFSKEGRYTWYSKLEERPIRLRSDSKYTKLLSKLGGSFR